MSSALLLALSAALLGATGFGAMYAIDSNLAILPGYGIKNIIDLPSSIFSNNNVAIALKYGATVPNGKQPH